MKKTILFSLLAVAFLIINAYALDFKIINMRDRIFEQSKDIRALMAEKTRDSAILINMFDSCLFTAIQLDAYFSMLGIFESVNKAGVAASDTAIKFITSWLVQIKDTNRVGIQNLDSIGRAEPKTKAQIKKLRDSLASLNIAIDEELNKLFALKVSLKKQGK
jgi:hypothetical protein